MKIAGKSDLTRLIKGCKKGDRKCQQKIFEIYYGKMMGICLRYSRDSDEAKDVLQEGFIKIFANIKKYNEDGSFNAWISTIMANTAIDQYRKNKNSKEISFDEHEDVKEFSEDKNESDFSDKNIKEEDILKEVQKLTPAYRTVFNMYVIEGYTHKEIADYLGITEGTSKSNLAKARKNLQKVFSKAIETE